MKIVKGIDEVFLDTGVILNGFHNSLKVKEKFTGFLNASEILSTANETNETIDTNDKNDERDYKYKKDLLTGINILGFPFRYSETLGKLIKNFGKNIN
ncbi:MAG TPA: hypothetical protein PLG90_04855, partial [Ignavibacteria bacterium]|nr:hypothetical protein [Ignavibacteria bacterium]